MWALLALSTVASCERGVPTGAAPAKRQTVVLYSSLPEPATRGIADAYSDASGAIVRYVADEADALVDAMAANEHHPPADLLLVAGTGPLGRAVDEDVLRPISPGLALDAIPTGFRDAERYWLGLATDMLGIVHGPGQAGVAAGYADLAGEAFRGRLCLRGAESEVTRTLVAALIAALGLRDAEIVVRGWRLNLAEPPRHDDAALLRAIDGGNCGAAIVGNAAIVRYLHANPGSGLAAAWPTDAAIGTQSLLLAGGIARHAGDAVAAADMLRWLAGPDGQRILFEQTKFMPLLPAAVTPALPPGFALPEPGAALPAGNVLHAADVLPLLERARFGPAAGADQ